MRHRAKFLMIMIMAAVFCLCIVAPVWADQNTSGQRLSDGLKSAVSGSGEDIVEIADKGGYAIVSVVRRLAVIAFLLLLIWIALLLFGGNEMGIAKAKRMGALALLCLILIFKTESIVVTAFELFGLSDYLK